MSFRKIEIPRLSYLEAVDTADPVRALRTRAVPEQYEDYLARREDFIRYFTDLDTAQFRVGVYSNQLASVAVSLSGRKVAEVRQEMQELVEVAAEAIDQTLAVGSAGQNVGPTARSVGYRQACGFCFLIT